MHVRQRLCVIGSQEGKARLGEASAYHVRGRPACLLCSCLYMCMRHVHRERKGRRESERKKGKQRKHRKESQGSKAKKAKEELW